MYHFALAKCLQVGEQQTSWILQRHQTLIESSTSFSLSAVDCSPFLRRAREQGGVFFLQEKRKEANKVCLPGPVAAPGFCSFLVPCRTLTGYHKLSFRMGTIHGNLRDFQGDGCCSLPQQFLEIFETLMTPHWILMWPDAEGTQSSQAFCSVIPSIAGDTCMPTVPRGYVIITDTRKDLETNFLIPYVEKGRKGEYRRIKLFNKEKKVKLIN